MKSIWAVLRVALFGWLIALLRFLLAFWQWLHRLLEQNRESERERKAAKSRCVPIQDPAFVRPEPLIYSQPYLAAHGLNYSWDNPDIGLFMGTTAVDSHELKPSTDYHVVIRVWNNSVDCPVVAMPVHLSYLSFGVGTVSHPVDTKVVDIGVKGGVNNPAFVTMSWRTPDEDGHYCLQALLDPVDDLEYGNNLGQHNTDVAQAHSPATFSFALRNNTRLERTYSFAIDTYRIGEPVPCPERPGAVRDDPTAPHTKDAPLPPGWDVQLAPPNPTLAPGAGISILATVTPPPDFVDSQVINVHAFYKEFYEDHLAGGVTIKVTAG